MYLLCVAVPTVIRVVEKSRSCISWGFIAMSRRQKRLEGSNAVVWRWGVSVM
jgi:hypothetical protein